jgi:hypothetical protein
MAAMTRAGYRSTKQTISPRMPSRYAAHVGDLVITDRANRIRRDSHDCKRLTDERSELDLESGLCPVTSTRDVQAEAFGEGISASATKRVLELSFSSASRLPCRLEPHSAASTTISLRIHDLSGVAAVASHAEVRTCARTSLDQGGLLKAICMATRARRVKTGDTVSASLHEPFQRAPGAAQLDIARVKRLEGLGA